MTYHANSELTDYVNKKTRGSLIGFGSAVILLIIACFAFYYKSSDATMYTINITVSVIISSSLAYSITVMEGKKLNKLIEEAIIKDSKVNFKTFSYRCLFFKIPAKEYELKISAVKIKEVAFPFNSLGLINNKSYCINSGTSEIYLCYECFSNDLLLILNGETP